jgi:hypothetical protein
MPKADIGKERCMAKIQLSARIIGASFSTQTIRARR